MQMIPVNSSSLSMIGYEPNSLTLRIVFRDGGVYDYFGIPEILVKQLLSSPSKGRFYAYHIKGRFNQQRIQ